MRRLCDPQQRMLVETRPTAEVLRRDRDGVEMAVFIDPQLSLEPVSAGVRAQRNAIYVGA